jgi:spermidine/putrescine transport system permease protein
MASETAIEEGTASVGRRPRRGRKSAATGGLLAGPTLWLLVFFIVPVVMVGLYSVGAITLLRNDLYLSLEPWRFFVTSDVYLPLFWKSARMSMIVSITSVGLAYPIAYLLALVSGSRKYTLLLIIIAPALTSYLLRVLAWRVILGESGLINSFLLTAGIVDEPIQAFFNSQLAVYIVLSYVWVPFVALPIFVSLESLDTHLLEASNDLGATRWRTFWSVTFPLSLPGVGAAFVFVFIPTLGEYITPQLVGGPGGFMFGSAIQSAFTAGLDWQFGSAMAMFLIFAVAVLLAIFGRFLKLKDVAI